MQHYEVVFLVHSSRSAQVPEIIQRYKSIIESGDGKVHRLEDWGLRKLAYAINKSDEAHYVLMNIECTSEARKEITETFRFSDAILRNLILSRECPILEPSPIIREMEKAKENEKDEKIEDAKEQSPLSDDDEAKVPLSQPDPKNDEISDEKIQASEEELAKPTEQTVKADENNTQTPAEETTVGENHAEDTPAKTEHAVSTKD